MSYLLLLIYLPLCCWLLIKNKFVAGAGIPGKIVLGIFLLKVLAGIFNGWLSFEVMPEATDTEAFHREGLIEYHLLFTHPKEYFLNIFSSGYPNGYAGFFASQNSYWNDLKSNLIIKLLSVFNIFSFGNYYVNVVFYNFITFFGHIALFRIFKDTYKQKEKICIVTCFLLPSLLYFSSCIHKEGLIFAAIGILLFATHRLIHSGLSFLRISAIILSCLFIFLQRNFVLIVMIPALIGWIIGSSKKLKPLTTFLLLYLIVFAIVFAIGNLYPSYSLPQKLVQRQQDFMGLPKAATTIAVDTIQPNIKSFVKSAPEALKHSLLTPYLFEKNKSGFLVLLAVEVMIYLLLFLLLLFFHQEGFFKTIHPFTLFAVFFGISIFLVIGYTIPIVGAIVRYRSIYWPFILTPIFCSIDLRRFLRFFKIKK